MNRRARQESRELTLRVCSGALLRHVAGSVSAASVAVLVWGLFLGWFWLLWLVWGRFLSAFFRVPWSSPPNVEYRICAYCRRRLLVSACLRRRLS